MTNKLWKICTLPDGRVSALGCTLPNGRVSARSGTPPDGRVSARVDGSDIFII